MASKLRSHGSFLRPPFGDEAARSSTASTTAAVSTASNGWNETACKSGFATHVCKVLATSRWHHYLQTYFKELGSDHFEVWLMEELLTKDSAKLYRIDVSLPRGSADVHLMSHGRQHCVRHG